MHANTSYMYFAYKFLLSRKVVQHSLLHAVLTAAVLSRQSLDQFVHRDSYHATAKHAQHTCRDSLQKCLWASFLEQVLDNLDKLISFGSNCFRTLIISIGFDSAPAVAPAREPLMDWHTILR